MDSFGKEDILNTIERLHQSSKDELFNMHQD